MSDEVYGILNSMAGIMVDPLATDDERFAAQATWDEAFKLLKPEYRFGRPVISPEMASKMKCPFPTGDDL